MIGRKSGGKERSSNGSDKDDLLEDVFFGNIVGDVIEDGVERPL